MTVGMETIQAHSDARGVVFEPVDLSVLRTSRNCHVVITEPGEIRGNHYHRRGTETVGIMGPARVRYREAGGDLRDVDIPEDRIIRFVFPPGIPHAIHNTGPRPNLLIAFVNVEHDPDDPDTAREVLLEAGSKTDSRD